MSRALPLTASASERSPLGWSRVIGWLLGVEVIVLLAFAQVIFAGYSVGVGNQSIQIPFLKHWIDPGLYANDPMVQNTLADYPSFFFRGLAVLVAKVDLYSTYFWLHVATCAAVFGAAYGLGMAMFKNRASAAVLVLLMLAGHHRALAGDDLYSVGFTHTWAVFPLAILAMAMFYAEWHLLTFALVGVIFNLHALTAGYLLVMFLAWGVTQFRQPGFWWRMAMWIGLFAVIASPTVLEMLRHKQVFTRDWFDRTRLRSADHSFPFTWWTAGSTDIPRFLLVVALAAIALSFTPAGRARRKSLWMAGGIAFLFIVGTLFSEVWPVATVIRAQLFRSSRLLMVLMLAHIAHGIVCGWRLAVVETNTIAGRDWPGSGPLPPPGLNQRRLRVSRHPLRILEAVLATATFICVAVPTLLAFAPWLVAALVVVALANGRVAWWGALTAGVALLVTIAAYLAIEFHIPGIEGGFSFITLGKMIAGAGRQVWIVLAIAAGVWAVIQIRVGPRVKLCALVAAHFACVLIALGGYRQFVYAGVSKNDPWVMTQLWAAKNTPKDALFLTPPQQGGFRINSGRSVLCEWRDGTQLYFSAGFSDIWGKMLEAIRPVHYDTRGVNELTHGRTLESMSDLEIVKLAKQYSATHVVLPSNQTRELLPKYDNGTWAVYEPRILNEEDTFIENVALPNIEKYRKSDARIELTDANGRTITSGTFDIRQTKQAFFFGASIPPFEQLDDTSAPEWIAPPVTPKQLKLFKDVFNYSMIPYSAKWNFLEPVEGERHYEELDKYVDWCTKNGITMEFHYLSGFTPKWASRKTRDELREAWIKHCNATVDRYHDKIKFWQVTNDSRLAAWAPDVFKDIKAKYPDLKLGISDCSWFWYQGYDRNRNIDLADTRIGAGASEIEQLQLEGGKLDYFASHGHKPNGVWPDMRTMYDAFDLFARYQIKIHISEATLDIGLPILGPGREGNWTPELAAQFYEKYYTVAFSHPAVEVINYWDLGKSVDRSGSRLGGALAQGMGMGGTGQAGMLDPTKDFEPRPLYNKLKELITQRWRTKLSGAVSSDGVVAFRGFHGEYEVVVVTPAGKRLRGVFKISPEGNNATQIKLVEDSGSVAQGE